MQCVPTITDILTKGLNTEVGKGTAFEDQLLLANGSLHSALENEHKEVNRSALGDDANARIVLLFALELDMMHDILVEQTAKYGL